MSIRNRRMISRNVSTSEKLWKLKSPWSKLLFTWMILHCDDDGRMEGEPAIVKAIIFPLEALTLDQIMGFLQELHKIGLISWYKVDGKRFVEVKKWDDFQTFHGFHRVPSSYPSQITKSGTRRTKHGAVSTKLSANELKELKEVNEVKEGTSLAYAKKTLKHIGSKL